MASNDQLISEFMNITGVPKERAQFYLESSGWELEFALSTFYENFENPESSSEPDDVNMASSEEPVKDKNKQTSSSKFASFASIQSDDSDNEGEAYYAGGSERGAGQQIIGPPRKKKDTDEFIQNLFKSAKESGAEVVEGEDLESDAKPSVAFKGTGYRLGDTEDSSEVVRGSPIKDANEKLDVSLKLWQHGFSIDDGELRKYEEPQNKEFLDSIHKGQVPLELRKIARGKEVNLLIKNHMHDDYVETKKSVAAFSGAGHTLGSPAPSISVASLPAETIVDRPVEMVVDETIPVTNIQLRLADGSRLVSRFNHSHTIADIRRHIINSRPNYSSSNFILMTTFPNKELSDESISLQDAKLLNAVLVQRMK